tara:strand:- start:48825 stop:49055 length:231 start_codon:yes stop_codon:yes gene_type:complete
MADKDPEAGKPIKLRNARMVLYWSSECGGLFGLAANGPKTNTRITAAVETHEDISVKQWVKVSPEAAKLIAEWKAC